MLTDVSRYMITDASLVVLDAGADREMQNNDYWFTVNKVKGNGSAGVNRYLYKKALKIAVYQVLEIFFKRRADLIRSALGVSVYYKGEKGTEITPEGCEQKMKDYLECLRSIVIFCEANKIRIEGKNSTRDEDDNNMISSRNSVLALITNECQFIKMKQEYKDLSTRYLQGKLTEMEVKEEKAKAWREIGNYLGTIQLKLQDAYGKYCSDLFRTFSNVYAGNIDQTKEFLRRQPAPETNTWTVPNCLVKANY